MLVTNQSANNKHGFYHCPFCKSINLNIESHHKTHDVYVVCRDCHLALPMELKHKTRESAADYHARALVFAKGKWNTRYEVKES